jgi:hypothetical protein
VDIINTRESHFITSSFSFDAIAMKAGKTKCYCVMLEQHYNMYFDYNLNLYVEENTSLTKEEIPLTDFKSDYI